MSKLTAFMVGLTIATGAPAVAGAAVLGPDAAICGARGPAALVRVDGLKARSGVVRVQAYGGNPSHYFDKGTYVRRVDVNVPAAGPLDVCVKLPSAGAYAFSVRHDVDGSGKTGMEDGGGMSGNPKLSLFDVMFKRKPDPRKVQINVDGVTRVTVTLNYVKGGSFGPVAMAAR